eukprot:TRINITY_DN5829_c0_g1_i22.p1 TRINITY_DN5829_c0_g1~~TRINITY_DN5829_c0_g1_i22.p1  ORF type:complete len:124 (-),score=15.05 TRINITY_DN5829_c0_g1_i22:246-617(-)
MEKICAQYINPSSIAKNPNLHNYLTGNENLPIFIWERLNLLSTPFPKKGRPCNTKEKVSIAKRHYTEVQIASPQFSEMRKLYFEKMHQTALRDLQDGLGNELMGTASCRMVRYFPCPVGEASL